MKNFNVYIDRKIITWERCKWSIEANTEAEAKAIAMKIWEGEDAAYERDDYMGLEYLTSSEYLTPTENGGNPTKELILDKCIIHKNA